MCETTDFDVTDVEELANLIDQREEWSVEDWSVSGGKDEPFSVSLELEFVEEIDRGSHKVGRAQRILKELVEESGGDSVTVGRLERELEKEGIALRTIEQMKKRGDVYEPREGRLRST